MNLYATLFETSVLSVQLNVNPRDKNAGSLLQHYKSKKGFESLIFNPIVSVVFSNRYDKDARIIIPYNMIYLVANTISKVYSQITDIEKLYIRDDHGQLIIDRALAAKNAKKISAYSASMIISTTVYDNSKGGDYGISLSVGKTVISVLHHAEARSLIEKLEHLDLTSYTMLCAIADKVSMIEKKVDDIYTILVTTQERVDKNRQTVSEIAEKSNATPFVWERKDSDYF